MWLLRIRWRNMSEFSNINNRIKSVFANQAYKRIGENFIALSLLNGIYMLSPLILIPYLIRTIGTEEYGTYIFIWTFIYYFIFIVNYGFDFTVTKQIAIHKDNNEEVSAIFSKTFFTRLFLLGVSFFILIVCLFAVPDLNDLASVILLGIGVVIGQTFFPTWLFQGMQEMKFITFVNFITRTIPLVLVFIFVKKGTGIGYILLFQSIGYLAGGLISHFFALKQYKLTLIVPSVIDIKDYLEMSWAMFLTTIGVSFYRETNTIILGFVTNDFTLVGYYALADKVLRIFQLIMNSFSQAVFPHFGNKLAHEKGKSIIEYKRIGKYFSVILLLCVIILFLIIPYVMDLYLGAHYPNVIRNARILLPVIFIGGLNYYYGIVGLVNMDYQKIFTLFVLIAGVVNIVLCLILSRLFEDAGASVSLLISETVLCVLVLYWLQKKERILQL